MTPLSNANQKQYACAFVGYVIASPKNTSPCHGHRLSSTSVTVTRSHHQDARPIYVQEINTPKFITKSYLWNMEGRCVNLYQDSIRDGPDTNLFIVPTPTKGSQWLHAIHAMQHIWTLDPSTWAQNLQAQERTLAQERSAIRTGTSNKDWQENVRIKPVE